MDTLLDFLNIVICWNFRVFHVVLIVIGVFGVLVLGILADELREELKGWKDELK